MFPDYISKTLDCANRIIDLISMSDDKFTVSISYKDEETTLTIKNMFNNKTVFYISFRSLSLLHTSIEDELRNHFTNRHAKVSMIDYNNPEQLIKSNNIDMHIYLYNKLDVKNAIKSHEDILSTDVIEPIKEKTISFSKAQ